MNKKLIEKKLLIMLEGETDRDKKIFNISFQLEVPTRREELEYLSKIGIIGGYYKIYYGSNLSKNDIDDLFKQLRVVYIRRL